MHKHASWMIVGCGILALGCAAATETPGSDATGGSNGPATTRGSGGSSAKGGSGGQASGGSTGQASGGSTGQASGGSAGAAASGGASGSGGAVSQPDAGGATPDATSSTPGPAGPGPFGCTACKPIFDGKSLDGWETRDPTNWVAKDGVLASQGKVPPIWTKADLGNYRIFFKVRQVMGNHKPDVIFFGKRPAEGAGASGALGGAQFQPPNGGSWNYGAGGTFKRDMNPGWDEKKWHHCEVLVKEAGSFQAACCPMEPEAACKLVLTWTGTGRKHPFAIQMHNPGLFDEYKDIMVEEDPTVDELLCLKK